jgi:hypothetical protein
MTEAMILSVASQTARPAQLTSSASLSPFCSRTSGTSTGVSSVHSVYSVSTPLSLTSSTSYTLDLDAGDYISGISVVCKLPAIVNMPAVPTSAAGASAGSVYRAIVVDSAHTPNHTCTATAEAVLIRESAASAVAWTSAGETSGLVTDLNAADDFAAYYCDYSGAKLLSLVEFIVRGKTIQSFSGEWIYLYNEFYGPTNTSSLGHASKSNSTGINNPADVAKSLKVSALSSTTLHIALPLFFHTDGCQPFPRCKYSAGEVKVRFTFAPVNQLIVNGSGLGDTMSLTAASTAASVQTITIDDKPNATSSTLTTLLNNSSAPVKADFDMDNFQVSVVVTETFVDTVSLAAVEAATYTAIVAQPNTETATTRDTSAVHFESIGSTSAPLAAVYVRGHLKEDDHRNKHYAVSGIHNQLDGNTINCVSKVDLKLGNYVYSSSSIMGMTNYTDYTPSTLANHTSSYKTVAMISLATENCFPPTGTTTIPNGCANANAQSGSKVTVKASPLLTRDHSAEDGTDYTSGRGHTSGNSTIVSCTALHFDTVTLSASGAVTMGTDSSSTLPPTTNTST